MLPADVVFLRAQWYSYFFGCGKWLSHWGTKYWPDLRLFNNPSLIFVADDVDFALEPGADFALEPDAGLTEWVLDLGAIELDAERNQEEAGL